MKKKILRDVAQAFQRYAQARWRSNARVQRKSHFNGKVVHASGRLRAARNAVMRWLGERLLDTPRLYLSLQAHHGHAAWGVGDHAGGDVADRWPGVQMA